MPGSAAGAPAHRRGVRLDTLTKSSRWWLAPLIALLILSQRGGPDLEPWRISSVERSACTPSAIASPQSLPMFVRGEDCMRLRAMQRLDADRLEGQALALSGFGRDLRVWVNDVQLRDFSALASYDSTSIPLLLPLPAGTLKPGDNEIVLQLRSGTGFFDRSFVGKLMLGPEELLRPAVQRSLRMGAQGAQLSIIVALAILLMALPIAWSQPAERGDRWFVLAVLSSQLYIWNMAWPVRPVPSILWHLVAHAGLACALWAIRRHTLVIGRLGGWTRRCVDGLALLGAIGLLLAVFDPESDLLAQLGDGLFRLTLLLELLLLCWLGWQGGRPTQQGDSVRPWLTGAALLCLVLGVADSLRVLGLASTALTPYLLHWGILYTLIVLLVGQLRRVLAALAVAENSQEQLARALDQRSLELQHEFSLRQQAEQARSLAEERQRIMRDMHDGVGGQLFALIGQADTGQIDASMLRSQLRRGLDDLRLMIDSLDDACADLGVALGMLRQRLQPSLQGLPLAVHWQTAHLPDLAPCSPQAVLQVMRIVQEAITNAIKHSGCSEVRIDAHWSDDLLELRISDDGMGLSDQAPVGRGLPGMHQRAEAIGADLAIRNASGRSGTQVRLRLAVALA